MSYSANPYAPAPYQARYTPDNYYSNGASERRDQGGRGRNYDYDDYGNGNGRDDSYDNQQEDRYGRREGRSSVRNSNRTSDRRGKSEGGSTRKRSPVEEAGILGQMNKRLDKSEDGLAAGGIGAIAGAWIGHKYGKNNPLAIAAGVLVGGLGANALEKRLNKDREEERENSSSKRSRSEARGKKRSSKYRDSYDRDAEEGENDQRLQPYRGGQGQGQGRGQGQGQSGRRSLGAGGGGNGEYNDESQWNGDRGLQGAPTDDGGDQADDGDGIDEKGRDAHRRAKKEEKKRRRREREEQEEHDARQGCASWKNTFGELA